MAYHRRAYTRGNWTFVRATDVKAHCQKNPTDYDFWNRRLIDGKPPYWNYPNEQPASWTTEERERTLEALGETPDLLKDKKIGGIYRMKEATIPDNPASNDYADVALYNKAFEPEYILAQVLDHELAHHLFESISDVERGTFAETGDWRPETTSGGPLRPGRPESQFIRKNGRLSVAEDFADDITAFIHQPSKLRKTAPKVYDWISIHFGNKLKVRSKK